MSDMFEITSANIREILSLQTKSKFELTSLRRSIVA